MREKKYSILIIDDEQAIRRLLDKELRSPKRRILVAASGKEALKIVGEYEIDVIVMDLRLPDVRDLDLLISIKSRIPYTEIIMITGHGDIETAVKAMKYGVCDFIKKPFDLDNLELLIEKAHHNASISRSTANSKDTTPPNSTIQLIGKSAAITNVKYQINKVASSHMPVLITGKAGTGKNLVAHLIHQKSPRHRRKMISKSCASLLKDVSKSELFGHIKNSYYNQELPYDGLLSIANYSSLFLDDIGELPVDVQASLLAAMGNNHFKRVGEKIFRKMDIRFIFANAVSLKHDCRQYNETFKNYIQSFEITLPELKDIKEDLPLLVDFFLAKISRDGHIFSMDESAMEVIANYDWPGNMRELKNTIERASILAQNYLITKHCLPPDLLELNKEGPGLSLKSVEQEHILKILKFHQGNKQKTADTLGISRKTLYRKLENLEIFDFQN
ncbi:MAG: sigma-54 dependent transcriptional regulator [Desulfotalea sp.]